MSLSCYFKYDLTNTIFNILLYFLAVMNIRNDTSAMFKTRNRNVFSMLKAHLPVLFSPCGKYDHKQSLPMLSFLSFFVSHLSMICRPSFLFALPLNNSTSFLICVFFVCQSLRLLLILSRIFCIFD